VEQNDQPKKKKNGKNILTPQPGQKEKTFEDLRLGRALLKAIGEQGYVRPTPIQQLAVPVINSGKDVVASSITGSGKTAAFLLPILQRFCNVAAVGYIRALIVTPTRELAIQIYEEFEKLNKYVRLEGVLVIGASSIQKQEVALRNNPELVIGTPGRIIDVLMNSRSVGIESL
jgi:ATP-dependent RNA helicase DDX27